MWLECDDSIIAAGTLGPLFSWLYEFHLDFPEAVGRHSLPPFLSWLSSLAKSSFHTQVCKWQDACPGSVATQGSQLCILSVALEVGGLVRKLHWAWRGALSPGRGDGPGPLIWGALRTWADDTIWIWLL